MDLMSRRHLIYVSQEEKTLLSPSTSPPGLLSSSSSSIFHPHNSHSSGTSFPIIAIAIIGIMATAFLLVSYYIFVIKCCLNWHRIDILRRFSPSRRVQDPSPLLHSQGGTEPRGLDESVIRLIPVIQYKTEQEPEEGGGDEKGSSKERKRRSFSCECAVCLNEFEQGEKLRMIPNCSHVFHIDCIDVWLQNNANCPLCRTSISLSSKFHIDQLLTRTMPPNSSSSSPSSPQDQNLHPNLDEDFVVIELVSSETRENNNNNNGLEQSLLPPRPTCPVASNTSISPCSARNKSLQKKSRKVMQTSMGDECIDIREKDESFSVQPIRRSFSMDSSGDRHFYLAVQEALKQHKSQNNVQGGGVGINNNEAIGSSNMEGCGGGSGRAKRSFFSFGHGSSRSRSSVLPVYLDP